MTSLTWAGRIAAATVQSTPRQVGAVPVVYPLLEELRVRDTINALRQTGADIDLGRLVEVLTLNRLMAPQPLYRVGKWAAQTVVVSMFGLVVQKLYDQRFGRGLDDLYPILGEAWVALAARAVQQEGIDLSVVHWDTTSVYLEGEYEDSELAAYGHSSDRRSGNKQIKVGLDVTSRERMPLLYRLLNGSTADITTPVPNLDAIAAFLRRPECAGMAVRPLVVGDCKMITPAAVAEAHQHHLYYLGPWESSTVVREVIRSVSDAALAANELSYRPKRRFPADRPFVPYRGVWRPFPVTYEGETYDDRALVVWSAGKQHLDEEKRKVYLKRLLNRLEEIRRHLNQGRYIRREYTAHQIALAQRGNPAKRLVMVELTGSDRHLALSFRIDREALAQAQALDGRREGLAAGLQPPEQQRQAPGGLEEVAHRHLLALLGLQLLVGPAEALQHGEVGAAGEIVLAGGDDAALDRRIGRDLLDDLLELVHHAFGDDVHRAAGHVPGRQSDAVGIGLEAEIGQRHGAVLPGFRRRSAGALALRLC